MCIRDSSNTELWYFFEQLQKQLDPTVNEFSAENSIKMFGDALKNHEEFATTYEVNGEERQIYGISLPYSEWYLVSVSYTHLQQFFILIYGNQFAYYHSIRKECLL